MSNNEEEIKNILKSLIIYYEINKNIAENMILNLSLTQLEDLTLLCYYENKKDIYDLCEARIKSIINAAVLSDN